MILHSGHGSWLRFSVMNFSESSDLEHVSSIGELLRWKLVPDARTRIRCGFPSFKQLGTMTLKQCLPLPLPAATRSGLKLAAVAVVNKRLSAYISTSMGTSGRLGSWTQPEIN